MLRTPSKSCVPRPVRAVHTATCEVCALPYDKYEKFMSAYKLWTEFVENPDYVKKFPWPEHTMAAASDGTDPEGALGKMTAIGTREASNKSNSR